MRLVHIAIALTLIGFVVAVGVLARLNDPAKKVFAEAMHYKAITAQFQDQYGYQPGDFPRATEIWGIAAGDSGTSDACYHKDSTELDDPKRTCDGNGNGHLFYKDNVTDKSAPEWYRAWQHLANAGLMEGSFAGVAALPPRGAHVGYNIPESKAVEGTGYTLMSFHRTDQPKWFPGHYWGVAYGRPFVNPLELPVESRGPAILPSMAQRIDEKFDDGSPRTGIVRSFRDLTKCIKRYDGVYRYRSDRRAEFNCGLFIAFEDPGFEEVKPR